jgi:hypothetical protein
LEAALLYDNELPVDVVISDGLSHSNHHRNHRSTVVIGWESIAGYHWLTSLQNWGSSLTSRLLNPVATLFLSNTPTTQTQVPNEKHSRQFVYTVTKSREIIQFERPAVTTSASTDVILVLDFKDGSFYLESENKLSVFYFFLLIYRISG